MSKTQTHGKKLVKKLIKETFSKYVREHNNARNASKQVDKSYHT
jgi:predicted HD phosphohydrolase